jgi:deazaflavin-dependent oxidoreductase (nitroreductase family)
LLYVEDGDRYVLIGSNGGAEKEPVWVANVAAMPEVVIEVGERTLTILRKRPEWDRLHAAAVAYWPDILEYQTHTTRTFPLIVLNPGPDAARPNATRLRGAKARFDRKGVSSAIPLPPGTTQGARDVRPEYLRELVGGRRQGNSQGQPQWQGGVRYRCGPWSGRAHAVLLASEGADAIAVDLCDQIASVPYPMATPDEYRATRGYRPLQLKLHAELFHPPFMLAEKHPVVLHPRLRPPSSDSRQQGGHCAADGNAGI